MRQFTAPRKRSNWLKNAPIFSMVLWLLIWLSIDVGFWDLQRPENDQELQMAIRSLFPYITFLLSGFVLIRSRSLGRIGGKASMMLFLYGVITAMSAMFSPRPEWAWYWSLAYMATIFTAWAFGDRRNAVESTRILIQMTWLATFVVAAALGYRSRGVVFAPGHSGGDVINALNGLSRSSGVARWAAVPGLVCVVRVFHSRRMLPVLFYSAFGLLSFYIVYKMQSRGAIFGVAAALIFILLVSSRMRRYALPFAVLALTFVFLTEAPARIAGKVGEYLARGQSVEEFESMSGRTRAWEKGLIAFKDAPFFGRGQWTDRLIIGEHVHNSYLQAFMDGGLVGGIPYCLSWIFGWFLFVKLLKQRDKLVPIDRVIVLECGTVMMFFTVRSIPETTTAGFAVDLLVMVAVYVYLEALMRSRTTTAVRRVAPVRFQPVRRREVPSVAIDAGR